MEQKLEQIASMNVPLYQKLCAAEILGSQEKVLSINDLSEISNYSLAFEKRKSQAEKINIFDKRNLLSEEFKNVVIPNPYDNVYGFIEILLNGRGNCAPSAVLAYILLKEIKPELNGRFDVVKLVKKIGKQNHIVLMDNERKVDYNFTILPYIFVGQMPAVRRETFNDNDMMQYFFERGKNIP
jgi:hypothetical protein